MNKNRPEADPAALYGASEVAKLLQVGRATVYRYLKGRIRKATGRKVFTGQEIIEFWEDYQELAEARAREKEQATGAV